MLRTLLLCALVFAGLCLSSMARAEKRVALVVGIDNYDNLPPEQQLLKARNDATAMQETLGGIDFGVVPGIDLDRSEFNRKLLEFEQKLQPGDVAAVFYAGHGVEIDGQNYLLPRDIPAVVIGQDELLIREAIELDSIMEMLQKKGTRINLIILDACRDNPFADTGGRGVGGSRGLSRIDPPTGTFVMYSAGAHQKALDRLSDTDGNRNSVYTRSLIPLLTQPGMSIQVIAKDVQVKVKALAESVERAQHHAYYDQIIGDFYLVKGDGDRPAARPQPQPQVAAPVPVQLAPATSAPEDLEQAVKRRGEMAYLECVSSNELTCYKSFLADFPDHPRAKQVEKIVRSQIELPRFRACMSSKTYDDKLEQCHLYLDSFPNGRYRRQAEEVIEQALLETETRPQAHEPAPVAPLPTPPAPAARTFTLYSGYDLYGGDYGRLAGQGRLRRLLFGLPQRHALQGFHLQHASACLFPEVADVAAHALHQCRIGYPGDSAATWPERAAGFKIRRGLRQWFYDVQQLRFLRQ